MATPEAGLDRGVRRPVRGPIKIRNGLAVFRTNAEVILPPGSPDGTATGLRPRRNSDSAVASHGRLRSYPGHIGFPLGRSSAGPGLVPSPAPTVARGLVARGLPEHEGNMSARLPFA
jgi:hypothetical protein